MFSKLHEKEKAITLRKQGKTYNEILELIPVAKSTLSGWLKDVGLSKPQKQRLTEKKHAAQLRGGAQRHLMRIRETFEIHTPAIKEVGTISRRELLLIGVALYWAEGSKAKTWSPSVGVKFVNSDPYMVAVFVRWLIDIYNVSSEDIVLSLYVHTNHKARLPEIKNFWLLHIGLSEQQLPYVYFKKHNPLTKRRNVQNSTYYGLMAVRVRRSTNLNRRIQGWTRGICENYCRVV